MRRKLGAVILSVAALTVVVLPPLAWSDAVDDTGSHSRTEQWDQVALYGKQHGMSVYWPRPSGTYEQSDKFAGFWLSTYSAISPGSVEPSVCDKSTTQFEFGYQQIHESSPASHVEVILAKPAPCAYLFEYLGKSGTTKVTLSKTVHRHGKARKVSYATGAEVWLGDGESSLNCIYVLHLGGTSVAVDALDTKADRGGGKASDSCGLARTFAQALHRLRWLSEMS